MASSHYPSALYHAVHTGNPGDVAFYARACAGARRVLELGCGTGRVGAAIAAHGAPVVGLDVDRDALLRAAAAGVAALCADMRRFALGARFDRIIAPYATLYCLLDEDDVVACLRRAREHLAPGGTVIFDGYAMDAWHSDGDPAVAELAPAEPVATVIADGIRWEVSERTRWDPAARRADATYVHVPAAGGATVVAELPQRYLLSAEVPERLARAGLSLRSLHGGFDERPFDADSEHLVVRAGP